MAKTVKKKATSQSSNKKPPTGTPAPEAEYYLFYDSRPPSQRYGGIPKNGGPRKDSDLTPIRRCYDTLLKALKTGSKPKGWEERYGHLSNAEGVEYQAYYSEIWQFSDFVDRREYWPSRMGFSVPKPKVLSNWFWAHPFATLRTKHSFGDGSSIQKIAGSVAWRAEVEAMDPEAHDFWPVAFEFTDQTVDLFWMTTGLNLHQPRNDIPGDIELKIRSITDPQLSRNFYQAAIGRRDAFRLNWMRAGDSTAYVVSAPLAERLRFLILDRERDKLQFTPVTLLSD